MNLYFVFVFPFGPFLAHFLGPFCTRVIEDLWYVCNHDQPARRRVAKVPTDSLLIIIDIIGDNIVIDNTTKVIIIDIVGLKC